MKKGSTGFKPENLAQTDIPTTWKAMEKLYDSGKAKAIGVSNFSTKKLGDLLSVARIPPAVNQVELHPQWQQPKLKELCQSKGVHLTVSVLIQSRISLMINDYWYHAYSNEYNVSFQGYSPLGSPGTTSIKGDVLKNPVLALVAENLGKTPAQVALRWGLQSGHSVLPKSTKEARIKENFDVFDWSIPEDLVSKFSELKQACLFALLIITSLFNFNFCS